MTYAFVILMFIFLALCCGRATIEVFREQKQRRVRNSNISRANALINKILYDEETEKNIFC